MNEGYQLMCNYGDLSHPYFCRKRNLDVSEDVELAYFTWKRYSVTGYVPLLVIGVLVVKISKPLHTRGQTGVTPVPPLALPIALQLLLP